MSDQPEQRYVPGLIGMSVITDVVFLNAMHEQANRDLGRSVTSLRYHLHGTDFAAIVGHIENGRVDAVEQIVRGAASSLQAAGADFLVLTANTISAFAEALSPPLALPILSIADATLSAAVASEASRIGILGTMSTIQSGMYQDSAKRLGLSIIEPSDAVARSIQEIILRELVTGSFSQAAIDTVLAAIDHFVEQGADGVALACTDLTLLADVIAPLTKLPLFDSTTLHAAEAARSSMN